MKKIALVGATGLVGSVMIKVLEERGFQDIEFIPVASSKSVGKKVTFCGNEYSIISMEDAISKVPDGAAPLTQKLIVAPATNLERSAVDITFHSASYT